MSNYLRDFYKATVPYSKSATYALSKLEGARCLVTGANGIVGYALARLLSEHSRASLSLAVRVSTYPGKSMFPDAVEHIPYDQVQNQTFDCVFHCATYSQPSKFLADWQSTIRLNTDFLLRLLEATRERLIFASSSEIYSGKVTEATEGDITGISPLHPRAIYIESKRLAEAACAKSGIARASRIALAAGPYPGANDTRVLFEIIRRARRDRAVSLLGGQRSVRQYQYTGACAIRMVVSGLLGNEFVYNNAGPYVLTLEDMARAVAGQLGVPYAATQATAGIEGAPDAVRISMNRFNAEFPDLNKIDPPFDDFLAWVIGDCT